jgi:PhzF family phenazine biosynthesis protein
MKIPLFYVDAFTNEVFKGNPAAVCLLESWLPDEVLQSIASEHNLSETAFVVRKDNGFQIKWFTPAKEVSLCGHATLAASHVLFKIYNFGSKPIHFESKSGLLTVKQASDGKITLDFPIYDIEPSKQTDTIQKIVKRPFKEVFQSKFKIVVFETEEDIKKLAPNMELLHQLDEALLVTAKGSDCDYVLRFFAPSYGIPEDPVTGSAHCALVPLWSEKLSKKRMHSKQLSDRGGEIWTELNGVRALISGFAIIYMQGTIQIETAPHSTLVPFSFDNKK